MKRRLLLGGAFVLAGAVAQGCVDNEVSFFIEQGQIPQATGTTGCIVTPDPSALHQNFGILDVSLRHNYVMYPLYRSEIIAYERRAQGRPEVRGFFVDGANVDLHIGREDGPAPPQLAGTTIPSGGACPFGGSCYQVVSTTFIEPASTEGPGLAVGNLEVVPSAVGAAIEAAICQPDTSDVTADCPVPTYPNRSLQVVAVIRPFGHTMGGVQVSGSHFVFPITFTCHSLVQFSASADNPSIPGPDCSSTTGEPTVACEFGQDTIVDCRQCSGGNVAACQPRGFRAGTATCPTP